MSDNFVPLPGYETTHDTRRLAEVEAAITDVLTRAEAGADAWGACSHEWLRIDELRAALGTPTALPRLLAEARAEALRDYERLVPEPDNHHNATLCPYCSPGARADALTTETQEARE